MRINYTLIILSLFCTGLLGQQSGLEVSGEIKADSIDVNAGLIKNVADPIAAQDAATKAYVDAIKASFNEVLLDAGLNGFVEDIDGNKYKTIKIGSQIWMAENLRVTRYNDGTAIPQVIDSTDWSNLSTPAYTWYNNEPSDYGALYNYYTVADANSLNVCPTGWHVPTDAEWTTLTDFLGGAGIAGGKMKEAGTTNWISPNIGATNESGFTGLPGGGRRNDGAFFFIGSSGYWWSSTERDTTSAWDRGLNFSFDDVGTGSNNKGFGFSVRCLRD